MNVQVPKVRGTHDILPDDAAIYRFIDRTARGIFELRDFSEIIIPTFERAELFVRSTGETTDIVEKEMYTFQDKKGRMLALRPEGTPGIVRAYLENNLDKKSPLTKFYYSGQMFRYDKPQEGRYREFFQAGCEYFGEPRPVADAEVIFLMKEIFSRLGITGLHISINSLGCPECRKAYRDKLAAFLESIASDLCDDCGVRIRKNPMRALDCKIDAKKIKGTNTPKILDFLCRQCSDHFSETVQLLKGINVDFEIDPYIVRGLDYYTRTVFELTAGDSDALAAGGRYDNLIEQMGGAPTPAAGFALGIDRTVNLLKKSAAANKTAGLSGTIGPATQNALATQNAPADRNAPVAIISRPDVASVRESLKLSKLLIAENIITAGPWPERSIKSQMRLAETLGSGYAIITGEEEVAAGNYTLRDMAGRSQEKLTAGEIKTRLLRR
ncbi:MAG: histidine--tRNA ligase [Elusimicrobiota bacterium]